MKHVRLHIGFVYRDFICHDSWVVMKPIKTYLGKGKNATTDNFFISHGLAKKLQQKKTSIMGKVKKSEESFLHQQRQYKQHGSQLCVLMKRDDVSTRIIYQCEPKKCVFFALSVSLLVSIRQKNESQRRFSFAIKLNVGWM